MRRLFVPLVPLVLAAAAIPSVATGNSPLAAAVAIGAIPGGGTGINGCSTLTAVQESSNVKTYDMPDRGVLTSWRFRGNANAAGATVRALVFRPAGGGQWIVAQRTAEAEATVNGVINVPTRLRVREGDQLGLRIVQGSSAPGCWYTGAAGDTFNFTFEADPVGGDVFVPTDGPVANGRLDITATWEPDGDDDGFGDVTQDACLTQASAGAPCDRRAPRTRITAKPAASTGAHQAILRFASSERRSTFRCSLDGSAFRGCTPPVIRSVGSGVHVFKVAAVDKWGNRDRTPAIARWTVRR